jgi:prepilin-type N-terminal cleavage/methylation domain-containing protein
MRNARRRSGGFTLLELILALGMVAMLSLALYMGLTVTVRARERAMSSVAPVRTALLAADLIRQDLESVLPCKQLLAGPFIGTSQIGADVVDFYCLGSDVAWHASPDALQQQQQPGFGGAASAAVDVPWSEGPRHVVLYLNTDVQPPALVRSVTRNLLAPTQPQPDEEILVRNVKSFTVRYFDGFDWQDSGWDSTTLGDILPQAVELTFEAVIDDTKQPPVVYKVTRVFPLACATPPTAGGTAP